MSQITNAELKQIRDEIGGKVRAWQVRDVLQQKGIMLDESTIRGRFIEMGEPLGSMAGMGPRRKPEEMTPVKEVPKAPPREILKPNKQFDVPPEMESR